MMVGSKSHTQCGFYIPTLREDEDRKRERERGEDLKWRREEKKYEYDERGNNHPS